MIEKNRPEAAQEYVSLTAFNSPPELDDIHDLTRVFPSVKPQADESSPTASQPNPYVVSLASVNDSAHDSFSFLTPARYKSPVLAAGLSAVCPGLGSFANGSYLQAAIVFSAYVTAMIMMFILIGFLLVPMVWVAGIALAYEGARRKNLESGADFLGLLK